jgi:endonuclease V-like protein UPF0215 family
MPASTVTVIAPILNLNGSAPESLREALHKAYSALSKASEALSECTPHGRDYPKVENLRPALDQHAQRQQDVRRIMKELMEINREIDRQLLDRRR